MESLLEKVPHDFPLSERPYKEMADQIGMSEAELIEDLKRCRREGTIRRVAAVLYHRKAAYTYNAMVVWRVPDGEEEKVGMVMAGFPEVSHCYERDSSGYWNYRLYTMIHGKTHAECMDIVRRIMETTGIADYKVFFSKREFKKTSLRVSNE
jgi:DNA-binding Lrp family transcriptional regulator